MIKNKVLCVIVSAVLIVALCFSVSASDYTVYSASPMSDSYRQVFEDIVINLRDNRELLDELGCDDIDYCYFRSSDYGYTLLVCPADELTVDNELYPTALNFDGAVYLEYIISYSSGYNSDYTITLTDKTDSFTVTNANYFVYSNVSGIGSNDISALEHSKQIDDDVFKILIVVIVFLLLFVVFKFLNKRWLLP